MERTWVSSEPYRKMIEALVAARMGAGLGQRELARRLGRHASWLNKIERLERRLDILEFVVIARAIGIPPNALMEQLIAGLPDDLGV